MSHHCWNCGTTISAFGRQESCDKCGKDTRACRNCRQWDPRSNNECREEQAQRIVEKEKGNFCEWFQPRDGAGGSQAVTRDQLKSAADALFKKK